jgi:hypothetical protein
VNGISRGPVDLCPVDLGPVDLGPVDLGRVMWDIVILGIAAVMLLGCGRVDSPTPGGGAAVLHAVIEELVVAEEPVRQGYSRDLFEHWVDTDGSGCTTRHKVLAAQATALAPRTQCVVVEGDWELLFNGGRHVGVASEIDVDHVVALAEAWDSGAYAWDAAQRRNFANDPLNLIVADRQVNKDKADLDAGEWTPSDPRARCVTAAKMILTKLRYNLSVDAAERRGLIRMASHCDRADQRSIGGFPLPGTPGFHHLRSQVSSD